MMHGQTNIKYITVTHFMLNTQSSVPEDGRNQRPKPVELIGIINQSGYRPGVTQMVPGS